MLTYKVLYCRMATTENLAEVDYRLSKPTLHNPDSRLGHSKHKYGQEFIPICNKLQLLSAFPLLSGNSKGILDTEISLVSQMRIVWVHNMERE